MHTWPRVLMMAIVPFFVAACGSPPMVRDSKVLAPDVAKASSFSFYFRNVSMRTASSQNYGRGATLSDNGFSEFPGKVAEQAPAVFSQRGIALLAAEVVQGNDPVRLDSGPKNAEGNPVPALVLTPTSGRLSANGHAAIAAFVFSAQIFDPRSRRLVWTATIDTKSWKGQDFVMKGFKSTAFDAAYAKQLLDAVVEQMARDGII